MENAIVSKTNEKKTTTSPFIQTFYKDIFIRLREKVRRKVVLAVSWFARRDNSSAHSALSARGRKTIPAVPPTVPVRKGTPIRLTRVTIFCDVLSTAFKGHRFHDVNDIKNITRWNDSNQ